MVSSSPSKRDVGANSLNKSPVTLLAGPKPLARHRIYLDVKNHITSSKLEAKIKELGGLLELFLVREVTLVVTDKEGWSSASKGGGICPKTPQTPSNQSSIYNEHGASDITPKRGRPKTRADAMLERARKTPTVTAKDTLEQAKAWGITIWSLEKAFIWLEKVSTAVRTQKQKLKVKELKAPYLKFESFDRKHRPVFLEIRNWPCFNLRAPAGSAGLTHKSAAVQNMTRKSRAPHPSPVNAAAQSGYCEVCRAEYHRLDEHLETKKHQTFVKDDANFLELDGLINDGTGIESFLKLNDDKCSGTDGLNCSPLTHKMPRTRTSSICDKIKNSQLSPTGSDSGHRLRTRRSAMTHSYIGITADDDVPVKPEGAKETRELRSSHRNALLKLVEQESDTWNSGRPKRSCIRQKVISVDDNVISENRGYYKVEVPTTKLHASAATVKEKHRHPRSPTTPAHDKSIIVKFRRMRTSELTRLNNEAENFLFPRKEETSSEEDVDGEGPNTTASTAKNESTVLLSSEEEDEEEEEDEDGEEKHDDEHSMDSLSSDCSRANSKRKRRMTHAESFIMDNKKYYKFETPGSRLRYQGSIMGDIPAQVATKSNGDMLVSNVKKEEGTRDTCRVDDANSKLKLADLKFSFEKIPKSEPWYETFARQDQGEQFYTCFSDSGYWKPFLLPYEMGPIPPLDPKVCIQTYSQIKKQVVDEVSSGSNSVTCSTPDHSSTEVSTPDYDEDDSKTSEDSNTRTETSCESAQSYAPRPRGRPRRTFPSASKNPRKSPRQHASTLAILSTLIQNRKKRELRGKNQSLESIPEDDGVESVAKSIDDMLTSALDEFTSVEEIEICSPDNLLTMKCKIDAIKMLEDYERLQEVDDKPAPKKRTFAPGKKPGRKKKRKNRTGWPNINRRLKKETVDVDESAVDSMSVNADSDDERLIDICGKQKVQKFVHRNDQRRNASVNKKNSEISRVQSDDRVSAGTLRPSDRVVDLERWENAEKVLAAKISNDVNKDLQFQPYVRVQKLDGNGLKNVGRRLRSSLSPHRTNVKRPRRMPASPKSPRMLRKPRGRWYRER